MSGSIGSVPSFQVQPSVVRQNPQAEIQQRPVSPQAQNNNGAAVAQANANQDFVNLANNIIAQRASAPVDVQPAAGRGQIVNLLV